MARTETETRRSALQTSFPSWRPKPSRLDSAKADVSARHFGPKASVDSWENTMSKTASAKAPRPRRRHVNRSSSMAKFEHNSEKFGYINLETLAGVQTASRRWASSPVHRRRRDGPQHAGRPCARFQARSTIKIDGIVGDETARRAVQQPRSKSGDRSLSRGIGTRARSVRGRRPHSGVP